VIGTAVILLGFASLIVILGVLAEDEEPRS
jgi:hypothetical protein